jgi:prepilin-type processing-associated H-X9-DG protein
MMSPPALPAPRGRPALTLVELIIVLAIIALLVGLLLPSLAGALGAVDSMRCRNRLRTIGMAYHQYVTDSDGLWPPILTSAAPAALLERMEAETGLAAAPPRPAGRWGQPGPHWSVVLWPYVGSLDIYTCPADPKAGRRGADVLDPGREHSAALLDAPPESYALNVILFRTADSLRAQAGCRWGDQAGADYNGLQSFTTQAEQRRQFPNLPQRILFFCGASGQTVGSQYNIPFRTSGLVERWEWHPRRASQAFADEPDCGSNYLFFDGHIEYRDALPGLWEWGYELGRPDRP